MTGMRSWRWLPLAGPLYAVLAIVLIFFVAGDSPGDKASGQTVMDFYNSHQTSTVIVAFSGPLLAALLILFFADLRSVARERRISPGAGPTVMIGGAVVWASGLLLGSSMELALFAASDHDQGQVAQTLNVLSDSMWLPYIAGHAITLIGAGLTVLSSDLLPRWLGWTAAVVGTISLLGPGGFLGFFVAPLWMLVAGVLLARPEAAPIRHPQRVDRRTSQDA